MLYLTEAQVRELLPMRAAIELVREAFAGLKAGTAQNQSRRRLILTTGTVLHALAGASGKYLGTKVYSTNGRHGVFHFCALLFDAETGRVLAFLRADELGAIRTGAATGYAADLLAAPDASVMAMIGSGHQARTQLEAVRAVRPIREVRVWSRRREPLEAFCREHGCVAAASAEAAVRGAHIVVTATNAKDPVIQTAWISPGTFIAAMGSNQGKRRELPADLLDVAGLVAIDSIEQGKIEAGDIILADRWDKVVELKDVQRGYDASRISIFESLGLGIEDVAAAGYVYERAVAGGIGLELPE
jgi:ornithine cyclodeaminase/alanine dehydrogenase-like protein (mu-crystallin family)